MCGRVPGLPPVPEQVGQGASELSRRLIVVPSIAASNGDRRLGLHVGPAGGSRRARAVAEAATAATAAVEQVAEQVGDVEVPAAPPPPWPKPPGKPPKPPAPAPANIERMSSYSLRLAVSPTTS